MPQIRLMGSDADDVHRTAAAVVRALSAWPETRLGDVSDPVPNRRGRGCRVYIEVLADVDDRMEVTVEREGSRPSGRRRLADTETPHVHRPVQGP
ncbi:hypothetical protein [Streptomyces nanshensis]|uniref:Uncharacterized protein n=1 Tax=Streptomyces nanshensis TaxID=518642 RepID=A0A1E7L9R4_9ACTN|nr:hypothetical protein [Streptomyces nanshensis]OEV12975.1 hypothetical protein AN218_05550 [Streptomyces nanshensis]